MVVRKWIPCGPGAGSCSSLDGEKVKPALNPRPPSRLRERASAKPSLVIGWIWRVVIDNATTGPVTTLPRYATSGARTAAVTGTAIQGYRPLVGKGLLEEN